MCFSFLCVAFATHNFLSFTSLSSGPGSRGDHILHGQLRKIFARRKRRSEANDFRLRQKLFFCDSNKRFETRVQKSANRNRSTCRRAKTRAKKFACTICACALLVCRRERILMENNKLADLQNWCVNINPLLNKVILKYEVTEREN